MARLRCAEAVPLQNHLTELTWTIPQNAAHIGNPARYLGVSSLLLFLQMRRLAASSILLLILGPFFAPLISAAAPTPVPVCCRRGGAHHCSTMAEIPPGGGNAFRATNPCPMRQLQQLGTSVFALPTSSWAQIDAHLESFIGGAVSQRHFTPVYSIRQRGPPALL